MISFGSFTLIHGSATAPLRRVWTRAPEREVEQLRAHGLAKTVGLVAAVIVVAGLAADGAALATKTVKSPRAEIATQSNLVQMNATSLPDRTQPVPEGDASVSEAAPAGGQPTVVTYTIQPGDTIWDLASRYGTTVDSIINSNRLPSSGRIGPGQTIKIPTAPGLVVTVQSGQTLWDLARKYGLRVDDIAKANNLDASAALAVGTELFLPGAKAASDPVRLASLGTSRSSSTTSPQPSRSLTGFLWPVRGPVTSPFGPRNGGFHTGIDIAVPYGTPVHAARAGTVIQAGWDSGYGYAVIISHGGGVTTLYAHNSRLLVKVGQEVSQGEIISYSGSSGNSTGPHVHFEIRLNGIPVDPLARLE